MGDVRTVLLSLQNDDELIFDNAPTDVASVSLSQFATALYTTPFDTFITTDVIVVANVYKNVFHKNTTINFLFLSNA